ncbi:hypothetical protein BGW36DRAFT_294557 [Talaromyces proteolyticus]|uniref:CENP-V/GFA domain-containing protein n=1 Tax=Talaromyces proteolyticus TaxID=1131652 RepID=A0AAD4KYU4_9EURO|nr:uncharacterized protein BGW36DRAFT_294557 [Talaromyces proteolyticus]KAH8699036.1 hypothetical protein BGW36DRAFT_294557 [Talaromyces proteolyticus]
MSAVEPLRGGCSCGRNRYAIIIPENAASQAEVFFSGSREHRHAQGGPLTAWLRVPLTWFQSHTISHYPDETHVSIRRTFTPLHAPHIQRHFCGYCGTPLTYWTEEPREEADFMSVALGSLFGDDLGLLEDLDLLPVDIAEEETRTDERAAQATPSSVPTAVSAPTAGPSTTIASRPSPFVTSFRQGTLAGVPWFEEMIEGSRLGRIMRSRRGFGVNEDQSTTFEWEISEWQDDSDVERHAKNASSSSSGAKRKAENMSNI